MSYFYLLLFSVMTLASPKDPIVKDDKLKDITGAIKGWGQGEQKAQLNLPVEKFQLDNGLTVLLHQNNSVPLISYHTWYKVGSKDEPVGQSGIAHMLEHMMFKGAKKYSGKDFDRILHENGITNNAFTSHDYTGFYQSLPSSKLELMMDMEVDRMQHLALKEEDLLSEREVVKEERRLRVDNEPSGLMREKIFASMFPQHPYGVPVIGTMEDIGNYSIQNLRKFYDTYYVPSNAVLVIAGDIDLENTKNLVKKYYGTLPKKPAPGRLAFIETPATAAKKELIRQPVQVEMASVSFKSVRSGSDESYALDLLAQIIGQGKSSRLYKKLVYQEQTALAVTAYNYTPEHDGLFSVSVTLKPGVPRAKILTSVDEVVFNSIYETKISESELVKAKNQVMSSYVEGLMTNDNKAQTLAVNEILFADYQRFFSDLEKYNQVKVSDLYAVAKKYLAPEHRVEVLLLNQDEKVNR